MPTYQSLELLKVIEEVLARQLPFGDSAYILEQFQFCTKRRLDIVSRRLASAGRLLAALHRANSHSNYRVCGNTVVRCAVQHAHTQVETDAKYGLSLEDCEEIFDATAAHIESGKPGTPFEGGPAHLRSLGKEPYHGWIWNEEYPNDLWGRSFRFLISQNYGDPLCTP